MKNLNDEYFNYLLNKYGLLNEYQLYEIGISFDEYSYPDDETIRKIEEYINKKSRD